MANKKKSAPPQIFTIGFTKKSAKTFFELLELHGVTDLIDVRLYNSSQLYGFAKKLIIADRLTGERRFLPYAVRQADLLLGTNPFGISYITGIGENCCKDPHYRPSVADGIEESVPGLVSGGPNSALNDWFAKESIPEGTPPMKCYKDDKMCYSLNEITIYWNSPAVFTFAFFSEV